MRVPATPLAHLLVFWGGLQMGFHALGHNPEAYAKAVRCPVLLMHGGKDPRVTVDEAQKVFVALPCDKELKVFEHLGHESYVAACPDDWEEAVVPFLDRLPRKSIA